MAVLFGILCLSCSVWAAPYMRADGFIDSPATDVQAHGMFTLGLGATLVGEPDAARHETLLAIDLGLLDRLGLGLTRLDFGADDWLMVQAKLQVLREVEARPAISLGIEHVGETVDGGNTHLGNRYHTNSPYVVLSKRFTLPVVQQFEIHTGWGDGRFRQEGAPQDWLHGAFVGLRKGWTPRHLRGVVQGNVDLNVYGASVGLRYQLLTGVELQASIIGLGEEETRYWFGLSWSNRILHTQIRTAESLARTAAQLALEGETMPENSE